MTGANSSERKQNSLTFKNGHGVVPVLYAVLAMMISRARDLPPFSGPVDLTPWIKQQGSGHPHRLQTLQRSRPPILARAIGVGQVHPYHSNVTQSRVTPDFLSNLSIHAEQVGLRWLAILRWK